MHRPVEHNGGSMPIRTRQDFAYRPDARAAQIVRGMTVSMQPQSGSRLRPVRRCYLDRTTVVKKLCVQMNAVTNGVLTAVLRIEKANSKGRTPLKSYNALDHFTTPEMHE